MYKVYVHICPNGKRYYGATMQDVEERWRKGKGYKTQKFYKAIQEFGWNNIEHIIIAKGLTQDEAYWLEEQLTREWNKSNPNESYNVDYGKKHSEEYKKKYIGENHHRYGKHHTEETKKKISNSNSRKHHTEETKKKISKAFSKSVICITTKKIFFSAKDGAKYYGMSNSNVTRCCQYKIKYAGKYKGQKLVWRYLIWKHNKKYRIKDKELTI